MEREETTSCNRGLFKKINLWENYSEIFKHFQNLIIFDHYWSLKISQLNLNVTHLERKMNEKFLSFHSFAIQQSSILSLAWVHYKDFIWRLSETGRVSERN